MKHRNIRLLFVSTRPWLAIEPLLRAFDVAGFRLALAHAEPDGAAAPDTDVRLYPAPPPQLGPTVELAMREWAPDLAVPTDGVSLRHLTALHAGGAPAVTRLVKRSLGAPEAVKQAMSPTGLLAIARELSLPVPNAVEVADEAALRALLASVPLPVVLRGDAGLDRGAETVPSREAGIAAFRRLAGAGGAVRRWLARNAPLPFAVAPAAAIAVQQHIDGVGAKRLVVARYGRVLGGFSVEPLPAGGGPTLVPKFIRHPAMAGIAAKIVSALDLSGLVEFDFVLEHGSRHGWLVAVKPYAGPIAHLAAAGEPSLPALLHQAFAGQLPRLPHPAHVPGLTGARRIASRV